MSYSIDIPAPPPLAAPGAANTYQLSVPIANVIGRGTVRNIADVVDSVNETRCIKRLKEVGLATDTEEAGYIIRQQAVVEEHVASLYAGAGAPPWGAALANQLTALTNQVAAQHTALANQIGGLQEGLLHVEARLENAKISRKNKRSSEFNHDWSPKRKEEPGFMSAADLAAITPGGGGVHLPAFHGAPAEVGRRSNLKSAGGVFPDNEDTLEGMTHQDILMLIRWYNEDIGIVQADSIGARRKKVQHWIFGY